MLSISIPKPCHESWNEMLPIEKGAFCKVCAKTVVDFTLLRDEEIKIYFTEHRGQNTCGRFRNEQLTATVDLLPLLLIQNVSFWKKFLAIVVILFGSFLSSCHEPIYEKKSNEIFMTTGVTLYEINEEKQMTEELLLEKCMITKGFTIPVIVGDIEVVNTEIGIIELAIPDTIIQDIKSSKEKKDTIGRPDPTKKECNENKKDTTTKSIIFY